MLAFPSIKEMPNRTILHLPLARYHLGIFNVTKRACGIHKIADHSDNQLVFQQQKTSSIHTIREITIKHKSRTTDD